jgi:putative acetyltransferase
VNTAGIVMRAMRPEDARIVLQIHRASIRGLVAHHYSPAVVEAWAPPITDSMVERLQANRRNTVPVVAEVDGELVGFATLSVTDSALQSCYVHPKAVRRGVGSALVAEIERIAVERGIASLHVEASINAEVFYAALGYRKVEDAEHVLSSGQRMRSVNMVKLLIRE